MSSPNNAYKTHRGLTTTGATSADTGIISCATGLHEGGGVQITGTFSATLQFEQTLDGGTTWIAKTVYPVGGGAGVTSTTATGQWKFDCGGATNFRVRCSAYTSGTASVDIVLTAGRDASGSNGATGVAGAPLTTSLYTQGNVSFSSSGENTVVSGVASQKVRVYALALTFASPVDVTIKDAASGNTLGVFQGVTSLVLDEFSNGSPRFVTATAGAFIVSLSSAVACKGTIWYTQG